MQVGLFASNLANTPNVSRMVLFFPETSDLCGGWIATPEGTDTMEKEEL
jgi:hypothetical protein